MPAHAQCISPKLVVQRTPGTEFNIELLNTGRLLRQQSETDRALLELSALTHDLGEQSAAATMCLNETRDEVVQLTRIAEARRKQAELALTTSARVEELSKNLSRLLDVRTQEVATARAAAAAYRLEIDRLRGMRLEHQPRGMMRTEELRDDLVVATPDPFDVEENVRAEHERLKEANAAISAIIDRNDALTNEHLLLSSQLLKLEKRERQATKLARNRDRELSQLKSRLCAASQRIDDLLSSTSWRVTAPMRALRDVFRRKRFADDRLVELERVEQKAVPLQAVNP